jgi:hypothetical protein
MTRDEALAWLNDRLGEEFSVDVLVRRRDRRRRRVFARGELRPWGDDFAREWGYYTVGGETLVGGETVVSVNGIASRLIGDDVLLVDRGEGIYLELKHETGGEA